MTAMASESASQHVFQAGAGLMCELAKVPSQVPALISMGCTQSLVAALRYHPTHDALAVVCIETLHTLVSHSRQRFVDCSGVSMLVCVLARSKRQEVHVGALRLLRVLVAGGGGGGGGDAGDGDGDCGGVAGELRSKQVLATLVASLRAFPSAEVPSLLERYGHLFVRGVTSMKGRFFWQTVNLFTSNGRSPFFCIKMPQIPSSINKAGNCLTLTLPPEYQKTSFLQSCGRSFDATLHCCGCCCGWCRYSIVGCDEGPRGRGCRGGPRPAPCGAGVPCVRRTVRSCSAGPRGMWRGALHRGHGLALQDPLPYHVPRSHCVGPSLTQHLSLKSHPHLQRHRAGTILPTAPPRHSRPLCKNTKKFGSTIKKFVETTPFFLMQCHYPYPSYEHRPSVFSTFQPPFFDATVSPFFDQGDILSTQRVREVLQKKNY